MSINKNLLCLLIVMVQMPTLAQISLSAQKVAQQGANVILIMTDDQGYGDIAAHGNEMIRTPQLDLLRSESYSFDNFHVDPTCAPTRSALMTGRYSSRVGVWHTIMGRSLLRRDEVCMADIFRANGYRTGIFGKWHLGDNYPYRPQDRGFDETWVHGGGGIGQGPDYFGNDYFDDTYFHNGKPVKCAGYCTDVWFDQALQFIEENRKHPFFCYLSLNAPHGPYLVADDYSAPYKQDARVPNANFYGMITNFDDNLGRLRAHLKRLGLVDETIFMFMTDNGSAVGQQNTKGFNAGMRGRKGSQYEGGHRVPLFIRWPAAGILKQRSITALAAHLDILPTLIDLCGLEYDDRDSPLDGRSLRPLLLQGQERWPETRQLMVESQRIRNPRKWRQCAVMSGFWRLIDGQQLYRLDTDPGQQHDLAEMHPDKVSQLRAVYEQWWQSVSRRHGEMSPISLGGRENPVRLMSHDWICTQHTPWNQSHVRKGTLVQNGFWAVDVEQAGEYEIELRRWPAEDGRAFREGAFKATSVSLDIADHQLQQSVQDDQVGIRFRLNLPRGQTRLATSMTDAEGRSGGVYYAYVRKLRPE
jgi:arylsulfatase A-like enzyme